MPKLNARSAIAIYCSIILFGGVLGGCARLKAWFHPFEVEKIEKIGPGALLENPTHGSLPVVRSLRPVSATGIALTKAEERFIPHMYNDAARNCSIGYGHLIKKAACDGTEPPEFLRDISEPTGVTILVTDMATAQRSVMEKVRVHLNDNQYAALCDFVFNIGGGLFARSDLLGYINSQQFGFLPDQFRRFIWAGGKQWDGLRRRREREIMLFFDNNPPPPPPSGTSAMDLTPVDIRPDLVVN